ncbi:MAG: XRE family transcriptional regulator [Propionibacteriaceae bacterium]|jgi:predicted nucleotidyltransferase/DNA-binding XRE family transcriptional regulator|nr:XRE family transcriptional regulator [Propionibacteriaceae bacterium]
METLRAARLRAGLTQKQLAELTGVAQSHISGFESESRPMSQRMKQRLLNAMIRPSQRLAAHRQEIRDLIFANGGRNPMVFGSVARGEDTPRSDIDLLIDPSEMDAYYFILLPEHIEEIVGTHVDVVSSRGLKSKHARILDEAVPL